MSDRMKAARRAWCPDPTQFGAAGSVPIEGKDDEDHAESGE